MREVTRLQIDSVSYISMYKGYLFCTTPNCEAKLVFVDGSYKHFRTWKHQDHIDDCIHKFDRVPGRVGRITSDSIGVQISEERIQKALRESYLQSLLTEQERESERERRRQRRAVPRTNSRENRPAINTVSSGLSEEEAAAIGVRPPKLLKRDADLLKDTDVGFSRILRGSIFGVNHNPDNPILTVGKRNASVLVKFEEAFRANSPGAIELFHHVTRYVSEKIHVEFNGYGEVRKSVDDESFEFVIFSANELLFDNMKLTGLAAYYADGSI